MFDTTLSIWPVGAEWTVFVSLSKVLLREGNGGHCNMHTHISVQDTYIEFSG